MPLHRQNSDFKRRISLSNSVTEDRSIGSMSRRRASPTSLLENLSSFPYRRKEILYHHETSSTASSTSISTNSRKYYHAQQSRPLESVTCDPNASIVSEDEEFQIMNDSPMGTVSQPDNSLFIEEPDNIGDAFQQWCRSVQVLVDSPEMRNVICSSLHLAGSAGNLCIQAVLLPVRMPILITERTCDIIVGVSGQIFSEAGTLLVSTRQNVSNCLTENCESKDSQSSPDGLLNVLTMPSRLLVGSAEKVLGHVSSLVKNLIPPPSLDKEKDSESAIIEPTPVKKLTAHKSKSDYLERLRLDYIPSDEDAPTPTKRNRSSKRSTLLLRVVDLDLKGSGSSNSDRLFCVDFEAKECFDVSQEEIFDSMVERGFSLFANHPTVRVLQGKSTKVVDPPMNISWKSEGSTSKLLKKMAQMSNLERLHILQRETLVWSGISSSSEVPLFLARGVVPMSPRAMLNLLWDNSRTPEYNNFCLGRKTIVELGDSQFDYKSEDDGLCRGSKVIQSETRVPFTSMSVFLSCLMHARSFDDGYVIISRSVHEGPQGFSTKEVRLTDQKNEILWGINVLRRVPNHPHLSDMTSLSQVKSGMVPKFLVKKIGLMGIEDFFKNVRKATLSNK